MRSSARMPMLHVMNPGGHTSVEGVRPEAPCRLLTHAIRASLQAKRERLIARPIIAAVPEPDSSAVAPHDDEGPGAFRALLKAARSSQPLTARSGQASAWAENPDDGTCTVPIRLDYDDLWRGREKEILEAVSSTIESPITFLTDAQKVLLERSPREFLELSPRPESAELVAFRTEDIGGGKRVVELTLAAPPASPDHVHSVAIVPNPVQLERQLDALEAVEAAADDGPLSPLRTLVGLRDASHLHALARDAVTQDLDPPAPGEKIDEFQAECIKKAMSTPHFAVIQGPPGSGKTTVITSVIRRAVARGERVLVVSPTHVAVDNVVEKLIPRVDRPGEDRLEPHTMPVRYAARSGRLSGRALDYWMGSKKQLRGATLSRRLQQRLTETMPIAGPLYSKENPNAPGNAPLSSSLAAVETVICGTPIGILSHASVKSAEPGAFDLLIVDEVSKMNLPEFLAIAVKARRWVLVGDPEQLPPYNNSEENATTLDDVLSPLLELVCSVGAVLERAKPRERGSVRLVVVSSDPGRAASAIQAHVDAVGLTGAPPIAVHGSGTGSGIVVCTSEQVDEARGDLSPEREKDLTWNPDRRGSLHILVERGVRLTRPGFASGARLVEPRLRSQARIFETAFNVYHAQPWSKRSNQMLRLVSFRNGLEKYLPSLAAMEVLQGSPAASAPKSHEELRVEIAERYAVNVVSVYDWLTGMPVRSFDVSPLLELRQLSPTGLRDAVHPFVGVLKKQYRMHGSLSRVPRELFYFGEALHDGTCKDAGGCRVAFVQVDGGGDAGGETNPRECDKICELLEQLNTDLAAQEKRPGIMIITPYRNQRALLAKSICELRRRGGTDRLDADACTLDSCQGREAEYVFVSLVRSRATVFLDAPKRWNVALTRAKEGLFVVGNVDSYLQEAAKARKDPRSRRDTGGGGYVARARPRMSLLARIMEAYDQQIAQGRCARSDG